MKAGVRTTLAVVALVSVGVLGPPVDALTVVPDERISIVDFGYRPRLMTVAFNARVRWTNNGNRPHSVRHPLFQSPILPPGDEFDEIFENSGTFIYQCSVHPPRVMPRGTIVLPLEVLPRRGAPGTAVEIFWGSVPAGHDVDLQLRRNDGPFRTIRANQTDPGEEITLNSAGRYEFRSRVQNTTSGVASGFTPPAVVRIG